MRGLGSTIYRLVATLCLVVLLASPGDATYHADLAEIYGYVWHDVNENSLWDAGEPALGSVLIVLTDHAGVLLRLTYTDSQGAYRFSGLAAGDYFVSESDPEGFSSTTANLVAIHLSEGTVANQNFGDTRLLPGCWHAVDGRIWHDVNANGQREETEEALPGVPLRVLDPDYRLVAVTASNLYGFYTVQGLLPERYYVVFDPPAHMPRSIMPLHWGVDLRGCIPPVIDLGLQPSSGITRSHSSSGDTLGLRNIPMNRWGRPSLSGTQLTEGEGNSTVSGTVWLLEPATGGLAARRKAAPGVRLTLKDARSGQIVAEQRSDSQGRYRFDALAGWRAYYLIQETIDGYEPVLSAYWGVAVTDECEVIIHLENRPAPGGRTYHLYLPHAIKAAQK